MKTILVVVAGLALSAILSAQPAPGRMYHRVSIEKMWEGSSWTHVVTEGLVVYRRKMRDGDYHVTIIDGEERKLVCEFIPALTEHVGRPPSKGARIRVWGIARWDSRHRWPELHPVEAFLVLDP